MKLEKGNTNLDTVITEDTDARVRRTQIDTDSGSHDVEVENAERSGVWVSSRQRKEMVWRVLTKGKSQ